MFKGISRQSNGAKRASRVAEQPVHEQGGVHGQVRDQKWPGSLMVLGIFVFLVCFWAGLSVTFIPVGHLLRYAVFLSVVWGLLPYRASGLRLGMERLEWFMFHVLAVGPILLALLFVINFFGHGPERTIVLTEGFRTVEVMNHWQHYDELPPHRVNTDPDLLPRMRMGELPLLRGKVFNMAPGALGYDVITDFGP